MLRAGSGIKIKVYITPSAAATVRHIIITVNSHGSDDDTHSKLCNVVGYWHRVVVMPSLVTSIFLYACESWTLTAEL